MDIIGKWVTSTVVGVEPKHMGVGPIPAIKSILEKTGLSKEEIDTWEVRSSLTIPAKMVFPLNTIADKRGVCVSICVLR